MADDARLSQTPRAKAAELYTKFPANGLQDNPVRVQLGFKTKPLRDGGGKPSWGRTPPHLRPKSPCPSLAKDLAAVCEPWVQDFTNSIHQGNKSHPFSARLLSQIRENTGVTDGQLELISGLARRLGDPDWKYPLILREVVPLGVSSPYLKIARNLANQGGIERGRGADP